MTPLLSLGFEGAGSASPEPGRFRHGLQRINGAIADADFAGEVEVEASNEEREDALQDRQPEQALADSPPGVVSAGIQKQLERVEFVPLRVLDRILCAPEAMRSLNAWDFERFVATLIGQLGFREVEITPRSGDLGRDVLATRIINGIRILFAFECKRYSPSRPVGRGVLRALLGTISHGPTKANKGVLVTTSTFTSGARKYLFTEPALDGKDFNGLVDWLREYARQRGVSGA